MCTGQTSRRGRLAGAETPQVHSSVAAASHTEVAANLANQNTFQERSLPAGKMPGCTISPTSTSRRGTSPWRANARDLALRVDGVMSDQDKDKSAKDARRRLFLEEGGRFPRCFAQDWNHSGGVVARC